MGSLPERVSTLEEQVKEVRKDLVELEREVHGPSRGHGHKPVRSRLHTLEGTVSGLALAHQARADTEARAFTRREKVAALVIAGLAVVVPILNLLVELRNGGAA